MIKQSLHKLLIGVLACACSHSALADGSSSTTTAPTTTQKVVSATPTAVVGPAPAPLSTKKRSLAYLSCPFISTAEASDSPPEITNTGKDPDGNKPKKMFSAEQEAMMQNLSKMINVSNGGVWLAWKLPLSIR